MNNLTLIGFFALFIVAVENIAWIIVTSEIIRPLREWLGLRSVTLYDLITCHLCTSFWVLLGGMISFHLLPAYIFIHGVVVFGLHGLVKYLNRWFTR